MNFCENPELTVNTFSVMPRHSSGLNQLKAMRLKYLAQGDKIMPTVQGGQWLSGRVLDSRPKC